jgi:hypothetical protein
MKYFPVIFVCLRYFEEYLQFFEVFQNLNIFIPRFLAESLKMFCGTLIGKHSCRA